MGWLRHKFRNVKIKPHICWNLYWILTFVIVLGPGFMTYWKNTPNWLVVIIMSWGRLVFAVFLGGIWILCSKNGAKLLNSLLSAQPFQILNKYCYGIYLLVPVWTLALNAVKNEPTKFCLIGSFVDFVAIFVLSILTAFLSLLFIETPIQRVFKMWLK